MNMLYIPCANKQEAKKIARILLEERLAACINLLPIESMYLWPPKNPQVVNNQDVVILVKTKKANIKKIEKIVLREHSYDIPCVISLDAGVNAGFGKWAEKMMKKAKK